MQINFRVFIDALINILEFDNERKKNQYFISQISKNNHKKRHQLLHSFLN